MNDSLAEAARTFPDGFRLLVRDQLASTNDELHRLGQQGAAHGIVLLAHDQTSGRGRRGASWLSSLGTGLTFSILVRPSEPKSLWPRLALATGLAVAEAAESFGAAARIKWPNDVWIDGRKVAGILVEAGQDFAIIGIGINVLECPLPDEIATIATALETHCNRRLDRGDVLSAIIRRLALRQSQIGSEFPEVVRAIRQRCALSGQRVSLLTARGPLAGTVVEVGDNGDLKLKTPAGIESIIQADEVRLQP